MGSFYVYKCQWANCNLKADALDELLSHVETVHIPKERSFYEDEEMRSQDLPVSCIFSCTNGPLRLRYKKSRTHSDSGRDGFVTRIEKECTPEQLHDRFNFDEDDFASHPTIMNDNHLKIEHATPTDQRKSLKAGILKNNSRQPETHKCYCGKSYRSSNGLRSHMLTYHAARNNSQISTDDS